MKAKISFLMKDESIDELILEGSLEEIRDKANKEFQRRDAEDSWSAIIQEDEEPICECECVSPCKGKCGCKRCHNDYQDFLSDMD